MANWGVTVNLGTYESMHFHSGEHEDKRTCYEEVLDQLLDFQGYFERMQFHIDLITKILKRL